MEKGQSCKAIQILEGSVSPLTLWSMIAAVLGTPTLSYRYNLHTGSTQISVPTSSNNRHLLGQQDGAMGKGLLPVSNLRSIPKARTVQGENRLPRVFL